MTVRPCYRIETAASLPPTCSQLIYEISRWC